MSYKFNPFTGNLDFVGNASSIMTEEVLSFPSFADFPSVGESGKLYIDELTNTSYYWKNTHYEPISYREIEFYENILDLPSSGNGNQLYVIKNPFSLYHWNGSGYEQLNVNSTEKWTVLNSDGVILPGNYIAAQNLNLILDDNQPEGSIWKIRHDSKTLNITSLTNSNFVERYSDTSGDSFYFSNNASGIDILKLNGKLRVFPIKSIRDENLIFYYPTYTILNPHSNILTLDFDFSSIIRNSNVVNLANFEKLSFKFIINIQLNHLNPVPNESFDISFSSHLLTQEITCNINQQIDPGSYISLECEFFLKHEDYMISELVKMIYVNYYSSFGTYFNKRINKVNLMLNDYIDNHTGLFKSNFFELFSHFNFYISAKNSIPNSDITASLDYVNFNLT